MIFIFVFIHKEELFNILNYIVKFKSILFDKCAWVE